LFSFILHLQKSIFLTMKKVLFLSAVMFATSLALNTAMAQTSGTKAAPAKATPAKAAPAKAASATSSTAPKSAPAKPVAAKESPVEVNTTSGAKIEFAKDVHDYGNVKYGADGSCIFEFKNTGNAPLIISQAVGSCGCTVPEWPKEPINPGQKAQLKVKYDTNRPGPINKTVTITSNAVNEPSKVVSIKGTVGDKPESGAPVNNAVGPVNN